MQRRLLASSSRVSGLAFGTLAFGTLAFGFGCNATDLPGDGDDTETSATGDGDGDGDPGDGDGDPGDGDGDTGTEPIGTITGVLLDMQGAPLPSPLLQFCGPINPEGVVELCIPVPVDGSNGDFTINVLYPGLWSLKIVQAPLDDRNFTGQAFQLTFNEGDALDYSVPPIVLPETNVVTDLMGPTTVDIDDVLSVTVDPAAAISPDFLAPSVLGGLAVPTEYWRVPDVEGSPVLAAWSFSPFGIKSTMGGFAFAIDGNLGLAAGEAVVFHEIEKDNGAIHEIATGTVNAEATAIDVVPTGDGLHELTWLLVTQ
jgi:hypothetical protein